MPSNEVSISVESLNSETLSVLGRIRPNSDKVIEFFNQLEDIKIYYKLDKTNEEYILVEVTVPGGRWGIEFSINDIRIEKFKSDGRLFDEKEIDVLFRDLSF